MGSRFGRGGALVALAMIGILTAIAPAIAQAAAAKPGPAIAAMDAIGADDWLRQPSGSLLDRVIAASSKDALDAAARKDPRAQALVGTAHLSGVHGYAKSDAEAARFYRLAAASNPIAQNNLANMLLTGAANGGKPAPEQAAEMFARAARQGHPVAQYNLGVLYRDGTGVARDEARATEYFALAAAQGNAAAQQWLDRKKEADEAAAARAQQEALMAAGDADALYREAMRWAELDDGSAEAYSAIQSDFEKALQAYLRDANAGSAYALRRAADMYLNGDGLEKADKAEAIRLYQRAARLGDEPARKKLKELGASW